jgi:undecaprenyl-diphosphatase
MIVGLAQSLALVPGVSRSGITIMTGLVCGYGRESAARFSFLLAMPITAGACILKLRHLTAQDLTPEFIVGVTAAFVAGYASIGGLIKFLQKKSYGVFAVYRVAVGILILSLFLLGFRK